MRLKTLSRMTGIPTAELKKRLLELGEKIEPIAFVADGRGYNVRREVLQKLKRKRVPPRDLTRNWESVLFYYPDGRNGGRPS